MLKSCIIYNQSRPEVLLVQNMPVIPRLPNALFERVLTDQQADQYRTFHEAYRKNKVLLDTCSPEQLEQRVRAAGPAHADIHQALIYAFLVTSNGSDR